MTAGLGAAELLPRDLQRVVARLEPLLHLQAAGVAEPATLGQDVTVGVDQRGLDAVIQGFAGQSRTGEAVASGLVDGERMLLHAAEEEALATGIGAGFEEAGQVDLGGRGLRLLERLALGHGGQCGGDTDGQDKGGKRAILHGASLR